MKLLILGETVTEPKNYRGVDRHTPSYIAEVADSHASNQLFYWSTERYNNGYLDDLSKAKELVQAYSELSTPQLFEIVEITHEKEEPALRYSQFLGFDIASFSYSVLSEGMHYCSSTKPDFAQPLLCLMEKYFKPKLNQNFLFSDYDTASDCLECMKTLHQLAPQLELWEMHDPIFKLRVTGVYLIDVK